MSAAVKTTYTAEMLLRLRTSPGVSNSPPNFEALPDSCKSLFACLNPVNENTVPIVRHSKQADVSADSGVWNVSSANFVSATDESDRERLRSIRQTFSSRVLGGASSTTRLGGINTSSLSATAPPGITAAVAAAAVSPNNKPPRAATNVVAVSKKEKAQKAAKVIAEPTPPSKKFAGWAVSGSTNLTASDFFVDVPAAPVSRAEQRRTQGDKRSTSAAAPKKVVAASNGLDHSAPSFNPSAVRVSSPKQQEIKTVSAKSGATMDPAEWYAWWVSQSSNNAVSSQNDNKTSRTNRRAKRNPQSSAPKSGDASDDGSSDTDSSCPNGKTRGRRGGVKHRRRVEDRLAKARGEPIPQRSVSVVVEEPVQQPVREPRCRPAAITDLAKERRVQQRERQVALGTRTLGYLVMVRMLARNETVHPESLPPPTSQPCSKRSWDGQMRRWRQRLHVYDDNASKYLSPAEMATYARSRRAIEKEMDDLTRSDDEDGNINKTPSSTIRAPQPTRPTSAAH